jgi:drug/metabolite transporter (DMT)-like permease
MAAEVSSEHLGVGVTLDRRSESRRETLSDRRDCPRRVAVSPGSRTAAAVLTLAAAFASATYYILVLEITPGTRPSAILAYPFLVGGSAYWIGAIVTGHGRAFVEMWRQGAAYLRTSLLVVTQLSVLAATYLTGPVDASLLSLVGDVVATPIIGAFVLGAHRQQVRSPGFVVGLLLSLAGGSTAIAGGHALAAIPPLGWIVVPAVPLAIAGYVLLTARASERSAPPAVVGQSMFASGLVLVVLAPAIPGGYGGLAPLGWEPWTILVALGITSFFAAPVLYFAAIGRAGLILPPMLMTGIPVFTLLLSAVVLHLRLPLVAVLGIPVAVVGGVLAVRGISASDGQLEVEHPGPAS